MAWSDSHLFQQYLHDSLNRTAAFNLTSDTFKAALYGNTITPDQTVSAANSAYNHGQWLTSGEISNGGWTAGGMALSSLSLTVGGGLVTWSAANPANSTAATMSGIYGCLVYDSTLASPVANQGVLFSYFGGANAVTAGTFTIVWNAAYGIFTGSV